MLAPWVLAVKMASALVPALYSIAPAGAIEISASTVGASSGLASAVVLAL